MGGIVTSETVGFDAVFVETTDDVAVEEAEEMVVVAFASIGEVDVASKLTVSSLFKMEFLEVEEVTSVFINGGTD